MNIPDIPDRYWHRDPDRCWWYRIGTAAVWLAPRPTYCDRGHWSGHVEGIGTIDAADFFPRYYMDFERAQAELAEWLAWRLHCERREEGL